MPLISIIIPIFNEEEILGELLKRVGSVMSKLTHDSTIACELVLINDGSRDRSLEILRSAAASDNRIVVVDLSRNFGHQSAIQAGLETARGDAMLLMDGDLQDPPELLPEFVKEWQAGATVVIAKRKSRAETGIRRFFLDFFYKVLGRLSDFPIELNAGHFSLIDRRAVGDLLRLHERNRFLPGLRSWVGYKQTFIYYDREERAGGAPKMTMLKLMKYGFDAIFSFSYKPLRAIWSVGSLISAICILYGLVLIMLRILNINVVPGFTTQTVMILFLGGVQLISVGILGEYMGRIYDEVKQRPLYIINEVIRSSASQETIGSASN